MKKTFVAFLATVLMSFGLVATTTSPAQADCPYSSCIRTVTQANARAVLETGGSAKVRVQVNAPGNGAPTGQVQIVLRRKGGGFQKTKTVPYTGAKVKVKFNNLAPAGRYIATASFIPGTGSIYEGSTGTVSIRVKDNP